MDVSEQLRALATLVAARLRTVEATHSAAKRHLDAASLSLEAIRNKLDQPQPAVLNAGGPPVPIIPPRNLLNAPRDQRISAAGPCLVLLGAVVAGFGVPLSYERTAQHQELTRAVHAGVYVPSAIARVDSTLSVAPIQPMSLYAGRFAEINETERDCLRRAVYYEARGEPVAGQIAVAQVVLNRVKLGHWGSSICHVVYQGMGRGKKCQFSFACRRKLAPPRGAAWQQATWIADEVIGDNAWLREMNEATHFHRSNLAPVWRLALKEIGRIGAHVFYAEAGSSPDVSLAMSDGRPIPRQQIPFADILATAQAPLLVRKHQPPFASRHHRAWARKR